MITGLNHVSIVVPSLDIAAERLQKVFGLTIVDIGVNESQGVRLGFVNLGNAQIEFLEPSGKDSPIKYFLESHPRGGVHHVCLGVDDLDASSAVVRAAGARLLRAGKPQFNIHGERIAFVHPTDFLGVLVELEEGSHRA